MIKFLNLFSEHAENLSTLELPTYILSDSNIDLLKLDSNENSKDFFEICTCYGFLPMISKAMRFQNSAFSVIDHIFTSKDQGEYKSGVITDQLSDHMYTFCEVENVITKKAPRSRFIEKRVLNDENIGAFKIALFKQTWASVESAESPDLAFQNFFEIFNQLYELFFPVVSIKINKKFLPRNGFMTPALLISRAKKIELTKLCKKIP